MTDKKKPIEVPHDLVVKILDQMRHNIEVGCTLWDPKGQGCSGWLIGLEEGQEKHDNDYCGQCKVYDELNTAYTRAGIREELGE